LDLAVWRRDTVRNGVHTSLEAAVPAIIRPALARLFWVIAFRAETSHRVKRIMKEIGDGHRPLKSAGARNPSRPLRSMVDLVNNLLQMVETTLQLLGGRFDLKE